MPRRTVSSSRQRPAPAPDPCQTAPSRCRPRPQNGRKPAPPCSRPAPRGFDTESKPIFRAAVRRRPLHRTGHPCAALGAATAPPPGPGAGPRGTGRAPHHQSRLRPGQRFAHPAPAPGRTTGQRAGPGQSLSPRRLRHNTGVRAAMAIVLQRSFSKSKRTSTSNWAAPTLSPAQVRHAANDAHAPALIHAALPAWQAQ